MVITKSVFTVKKLLGEPFHALDVDAEIHRGNEKEAKHTRVKPDDIASNIRFLLEKELQEGEAVEIKIVKV